jgi:serine/threonine-protein kinase
MLAMQGRHADAGRLLLEQLKVSPEELANVSAEERRLISMAATYLQKAGDLESAALLFQSLGEDERAAESRAPLSQVSSQVLIVDSRAPASPPGAASAASASAPTRSEAHARRDSAREEELPPETPQPPTVDQPPPPSLRDADLPPPSAVASPGSPLVGWARALIDEGRQAEAGERLAASGLHYEAAVCFVKGGDARRALAEITRVPTDSGHFRSAARIGLRLVVKLGVASPSVIRYLASYVPAGPSDDKELELFLRYGDVLVKEGALEQGLVAVRAAAVRYRNYPGVSERVARFERAERSAAMQAAAKTLPGADASPPPDTQRSEDLEATHPASPSPLHGSGDESERSIDGTPTADLAPAAKGLRRPSASRQHVVRVSSMPPAHEAPGSVVLEPGMIVANRFRLEAEIGRGGMAAVFSATDLELDEEVALKMFSGQLVTREWLDEAVKRFREELKVCRKLRHPNIIQVYDIGIHAGHRYFTMELLRGKSLNTVLGEPLDVRTGVDLLIQACSGLFAAHELGIVHRDVKPENLFVTEDGRVKVMDFGIAKSAHKRGQTAVGTLAGTPEYMSPEQITGFSGVGPAADQYSLGVVAYQMFTGQVPFAHEEMMPILMMHLDRDPVSPREHNPWLPEALERVILTMLAKKPEDRYASCEEAARELRGLLD